MVQTTLLLIKPNAVQNKNIGEIITIIEKDNFLIKDIKFLKFDDALIDSFYQEHREKPFFNELKEFMLSGYTVVIKLERENAIARLRELNGSITEPEKSEPGTIRALFADNVTANAVHSSDSEKNARREVALIFGE